MYKAFAGVRESSCRSFSWHTLIVISKPSVAYVDRRSQAFGGRWTRLQAFGGLRGSPFASLWWQMELLQVITSRWWHTWIVVHRPLVADGVIWKFLVAYVDRRSEAFGGRWSHLQAFGGIHGSSSTRPLMAKMDPRVEAFGGIRGLSIASLWWLTWIANHKSLVADGVVYKPLGANVDYRVQAFGGIRGSSFTSIWWQMKPFTSLWWSTWIVVYKPSVVCMHRH